VAKKNRHQMTAVNLRRYKHEPSFPYTPRMVLHVPDCYSCKQSIRVLSMTHPCCASLAGKILLPYPWGYYAKKKKACLSINSENL